MNELKAKAQELLRDYGITPDPVHFGQHFLVEAGTIDLFVKTCHLTKKTQVLEIGPGLGFITKSLLKKASGLTVFEVDMRFKALLKDIQKEYPTLKVLIANVLQNDNFNFDVVCGALSYNIFEPLIRKVYNNQDFKFGVFIVSEKFGKEFELHNSLLSLLIEAFFDIGFVKVLPKEFFYPVPRTDGVLITLRRKEPTDMYHALLQELFIQGDKKVKNALREGLIACYQRKSKKLTKNEAREMIKEVIKQKESDEIIFQCSKEYLEKINKLLTTLEDPVD